MFYIGDLNTAVVSAETLFYSFLEIFYQAVQSVTGADLLASIVLILAVASSIGLYAAASRLLWSFARYFGLPFYVYLVRVSPILKVTGTESPTFTLPCSFQLSNDSLPGISITATLGVIVLLSLIVLGSGIALNALLSLAIAALFSSYTLAISLLLWRRVSGTIRPYVTNPDDTTPWATHVETLEVA
jgi:choline transport protein